MLELAWEALGGEADLRRLRLPDDPLPAADAIVSVGHVISYLPDAAAVDRALVAMAGALRPGGVLAIDICDLAYGPIRAAEGTVARTGPDWAIITEFAGLAPDKIIRDATTFVADGHGTWRRGRERHENVLVDTSLDPGAAGFARGGGHGGDVVRRRGGAAGAACGDRDEGWVMR